MKKYMKITGLILIGILIIISALVFFTRHLHPTPNTPTTETLTLSPDNDTNANQTASPSPDSLSITSIPAAEAWVLNLHR